MVKSNGLHNRHVRSFISGIIALLLIASISYLGVRTYQESHASSSPSIYASPDTATLDSGASLSVTIRENSGSEPVNSVQATMNYDSSALQYVGISEGGAFPVEAATNTSTPGLIRVARANSEKNVTGDQPVITVNFKVVGTGGSASISFDKAYSFLVRSSDSNDILETVGSGSYAITSPAVATGGSKPTLYINPSTGNYAQGSTINAAVRLAAKDRAVTTVQAAIGYPANQLQYLGVAEGGVFTTKQRTNNVNGIVDIIRGIPGGGDGIQGDNPVVTVSFKVIGTGGVAGLSIAGASSAFEKSSGGSNILDIAGSTGANYGVSASSSAAPPPPASASPSPTPTSSPSSKVVSPSQAATFGSTSAGRVSLAKAQDGSTLTELGGRVELAPVIDPAIFAKDPNDRINKVEYFLDGKLVSTQKIAPYTFKFDTTTLPNGTYSMDIKTHYTSGTIDSRNDKLLVNNKVTLAYVTRHYLVRVLGLAAILFVLALVIWKLVVPKFAQDSKAGMDTDHDLMYGFGTSKSVADSDGPVASDPTVVTPTSAPVVPVLENPSAVSAAQTTPALPMSGAVSTYPEPKPQQYVETNSAPIVENAANSAAPSAVTNAGPVYPQPATTVTAPYAGAPVAPQSSQLRPDISRPVSPSQPAVAPRPVAIPVVQPADPDAGPPSTPIVHRPVQPTTARMADVQSPQIPLTKRFQS